MCSVYLWTSLCPCDHLPPSILYAYFSYYVKEPHWMCISRIRVDWWRIAVVNWNCKNIRISHLYKPFALYFMYNKSNFILYENSILNPLIIGEICVKTVHLMSTLLNYLAFVDQFVFFYSIANLLMFVATKSFNSHHSSIWSISPVTSTRAGCKVDQLVTVLQPCLQVSNQHWF